MIVRKSVEWDILDINPRLNFRWELCMGACCLSWYREQSMKVVSKGFGKSVKKAIGLTWTTLILILTHVIHSGPSSLGDTSRGLQFTVWTKLRLGYNKINYYFKIVKNILDPLCYLLQLCFEILVIYQNIYVKSFWKDSSENC